MKKILFFASALAGLFFAASCQQEEFAPVEESNVVTFEVGIPEVATKAVVDDGTNINDLAYAVYRTSATTQEDAQNANDLQLFYQKNYPQVAFDNGSTTIPIELINDQNYLIVFWAQVNDAWVKGEFDPVKNGNITYPEDMSANNSGLAAFTNVAFLSADEIKGGAIKRGVKLERPFAQINIGTTLPENVAETVELYKSSVTVTGAGASYNPITKEIVASNDPVEFELAEVPGGKLPVNSTDYEYVAMNYIFANGSVGVAFNIETKKHGTVVTEAIPEVPVQTNYRTNIVGNLLTSEAEYSVTLDKTWGEPAKIYELWDGTTVAEPEAEIDETTGETTYVVEAASELAYLAALVNGTLPSTFAITKASEPEVFNIKLTADVDLNNMQWTAIGTKTNNFTGSFDGNNHTIKNLKIAESEAKEGKAYLGFFGYAKNATIKNVTFENVNLNIACLDIEHSQGHIGAVAGSLEGTSTIENVTVKGDIFVESTVTANGASRVAVVAGGNSYGNVTMKNVHVIANEGSYLKANNNLGALAGQLQGKSVFEDCSSNIDVTGTKFFAGGIIGIAAGDQTFTNCHTTGNVTITAGREGRNHDQYRVGGIAGGWADGAKNVCTLTDCSYTGNISGKNSDSSIANPLDYAGYVGRGYTLNGCAGSKVVIDDVEYVQAYNTAAEAGIYIVNGSYEVSSVAVLKLLADKVNNGKDYFEGKTIKLGADIDLNNEEWTPIGSAYKDHGFMGNFDGNGKTIKNLKITALTPDADNYVYAGLFGVTEGIDANNQNYIKNLVIENVTIATEGHIAAAAIAYPYYTIVENVTVKGNISIKGGDYTSGALAYTRRCIDAKNITVEGNEGSSIEGNNTVGGVISDIQMNGGLTANYSNFSALGLTIKGTNCVGGISGIICQQTLNGATVNNVTLVCDDNRTGIVAGADGGKSTLKNVSYENVEGATRVIGATYDGGLIPVATADELIAAMGSGNGIILSEDVVLTEDWTPVGTIDNPFNGVVNGNNHKISGLKVAETDYAAFIAYAGKDAVIKNLTLENVDITSTKHAAGVVCQATEGITIENVTVSGTIVAPSYAGGLLHNVANAVIKNCVNNANVSANRAGGIASWVTVNATIENVENNGTIEGAVGASGIAHGFAGTIKNAVNNGIVISNKEEAAAGIAGVQKGASTYEYCFNYGNVTSTYDNVNASAAGILGQNPGSASTLKYCANYGTITAKQSYAAGIAYSLYGQVNASYCYNGGAVAGADGAGAIAPKAAYGTGDKASYCLNAGTITSANGTVYQGSNNNVSSYYYDGTTLKNVADNSEVAEADALVILNGGSDNDFFSTENGKITVK